MASDAENVLAQFEKECDVTKKCLLIGLYASGFSALILLLDKLAIAPNTVSLPYINISVPSLLAFILMIIVSIVMGWISVYFFYQSYTTLKVTPLVKPTFDEAADYITRIKLKIKSIENLKLFCAIHVIYIISLWVWFVSSITDDTIRWLGIISAPIVLLTPYILVVFFANSFRNNGLTVSGQVK